MYINYYIYKNELNSVIISLSLAAFTGGNLIKDILDIRQQNNQCCRNIQWANAKVKGSMIEGRCFQSRRYSLFYPFDFAVTRTSCHVTSRHVTSLSLFPVLPPYYEFARRSLRQVAFVRRTQSSCQPDYPKSKTSTMSSLERDQLGQRGNGETTCAGLLRGLDHIRDPHLNKVGCCASRENTRRAYRCAIAR